MLRPWGFGVARIIRCGTPVENRWFTPRRAICCGCEATHILLPAEFACRRADHMEVLAEAVELNAVEGLGHRKIAARLGRPESTVRDWIRTFKTNIPAITEAFTARVHRATAEALGFWPAPAKTAIANALGMLMAHARVLSHLHSTARGVVVTLTWHSAALFAHGPWFFSEVGWPERCNTSPPCR
ncbi:hypothetical protein DQ353_17460 [Arthrobacter sp. AQ5-05]|nr:hypothetical protein DQ353_17460 [Arthrobacter sp. AQ5-05]